MMKTRIRSPLKRDHNYKYDRLQKFLYKFCHHCSFFTLVKLYASRANPMKLQHEFSLNGLRVAVKRLQDFWQQQKLSWREIRDISDEECPSPDTFFDQDMLPSAKNSLAAIIEHEEDEQQQDSNMQKEVDILWRVVNRLKEAENRILERYKYELKSLALDLKTSDEKNKSIVDENNEIQIQLKDLTNENELLKKQCEDIDQETYRKSQPIQNKIKTRQYTNNNNSKKSIHNHETQDLLQNDQKNNITNDQSSQTEEQKEEDYDDKQYYQMLYESEREKLNQFERKFENLRKQYSGLQEQFQKSKMDLEQSQFLEQDDSVEDQFKQELAIELASLKNKIQVLTDQANQAETMLLERDQQVKDAYKTQQHIQQELTQKRALCSVAVEEKKTFEANVKVLQNINKKLEQENSRLVNIMSQRDQQTKQQDINEKKEEKNLRQLAAKQQKETTYKSFSTEIQQLSEENYELRNQLNNSQRQLKDIVDSSRNQKSNERTQLQIAAQEIENLRARLFEQSRVIFENKRKGEEIDQDYVDQKVNESLNEAMEYLELKDKEIEKLRTENDSLRYQVFYLDKDKNMNQFRKSYQQSPMKASFMQNDFLYSPTQSQDPNQIKDLQNLLMVMSKSLQEKEDLIKRLQRKDQ